MKKSKIVELVTLWDDFERAQPGAEIVDFCRFFLAQYQPQAQNQPESHFPFSIHGALTGLVARMERFATMYGKKILQEHGLNNIEDFVYLLGAWEMGEVRKNELIQAQLSEFTSGIGVINRLLKQGWLEESPDPEDGRSRIVRITESGLDKLKKVIPDMDKMADAIFVGLLPEEKKTLFHLLSRLDNIHQTCYPETRKKTPEEIVALLEKYKPANKNSKQ